MVTIVVLAAILIYVACIVIMCHNAVPYQDSWDEVETNDKRRS